MRSSRFLAADLVAALALALAAPLLAVASAIGRTWTRHTRMLRQRIARTLLSHGLYPGHGAARAAHARTYARSDADRRRYPHVSDAARYEFRRQRLRAHVVNALIVGVVALLLYVKLARQW